MRSNEEKAALGVEILKNCRNELYSYFPYLDGAFASVSYEAGKGVKGIGTEGNVFYFDPVFLLAGYGNNPEVIRRGYLQHDAALFVPASVFQQGAEAGYLESGL